MGQIMGNGALSRRAKRRDGGVPLGEENADRQALQMRGHHQRRSASRAVAALALLSWGEDVPGLCLGYPPLSLHMTGNILNP
jgi:hypothetical protein